MEKSSKRGKIPQQDWPSIITRYESGETLASIARTYDCSPPAISYIVSRSRARSAAAEMAGQSAPSPTEPQLVKGPGIEMPTNGIVAGQTLHGEPNVGENRLLDVAAVESRLTPRPANSQPNTRQQLFSDEPQSSRQMHEGSSSPDENTLVSRHGEAQRDLSQTGHGSVAPPFGVPGAAPQNNETRRKLHLPMPHGNGGSHAPESLPGGPGAMNSSIGQGSRAAQSPPNWQQGSARPAQAALDPPSLLNAPTVPPGRFGTGNVTGPHREKEAAVFIDQALRERVQGDIAVFLAAFDAALAGDTPESRIGLREATDRLLRAGARTRIELERLEARSPLPLRDKNSQHPPLLRR